MTAMALDGTGTDVVNAKTDDVYLFRDDNDNWVLDIRVDCPHCGTHLPARDETNLAVIPWSSRRYVLKCLCDQTTLVTAQMPWRVEEPEQPKRRQRCA